MTRRTVFWLWLPLAISFALMMLEGPTVQSAMARLPDPKLNLAAFGMVFGISLIINDSCALLLAGVAMEAQRIDASLALLEILLPSAPIGVAFVDRALRWPGSMCTTSPA